MGYYAQMEGGSSQQIPKPKKGSTKLIATGML
jgi:hypothetical protein